LTIFQRFPITIFQNCSEGQTNVFGHFPNISEDCRRRPKKIRRCFDHTLTNFSVVECSFPASRGLSRRGKMKRKERDLCRLLTSCLMNFVLICNARALLDWTLSIIEPTVDYGFREFRNFWLWSNHKIICFYTWRQTYKRNNVSTKKSHTWFPWRTWYVCVHVSRRATANLY